MQRTVKSIRFYFAAGATVSKMKVGDVADQTYADVSGYAFGGFYVPAEFVGDNILFYSLMGTPSAPVAVLKLTKSTVTLGWNPFTADDLVAIGSSRKITPVTSVATAAAAEIELEMKS